MAAAENALLTAALGYAARGWRVFPLRPRSKVPLTEHGQKDATRDTETIKRWWARVPDANIAVALAPSNLLAIDVDPRNDGVATMLRLRGELGNTPPPEPLAEQASGRGDGGQHLIYAAPAGARFKGSLGPGVDVKHNGYVVLAPSIHPDTGRPYTIDFGTGLQSGDLDGPWIGAVQRPESFTSREQQADLDDDQWGELSDAVARIPPDNREEWLQVGMALHATGHPAARKLWDEWSQGTGRDNYSERSQDQAWKSFRDRPDGLTYTYIFREAGRRGWENPRSTRLKPGEAASLFAAAPLETASTADDPGGPGIPTQPPTAPDDAPRERPADPAPKGPKKRPTVRCTLPSELAIRTDSRYRVKGLLPESGVGVIYGQPSAGKTWWVLDLALAVALGDETWHGCRVRQAPVGIVAAENPESVKHRLAVKLHARAIEPASLPLAVVSGGERMISMREPEVVEAVIAALKAHGVRLVFIDTLSQSMPGFRENESEDMGLALSAAKYIAHALGRDALVVLVHHAGKDESRGARGHSSLLGNIDVELHVQREGKTETLFIEGTKARDGRLFPRKYFRLEGTELMKDEDGDPIENVELVPLTGAPDDHGAPQDAAGQFATVPVAPPLKGLNQETFMRLMGAMVAPQTDPSLPAGSLAVEEEKVLARFCSEAQHILPNGKNSPAAVRHKRALETMVQLTNSGHIERKDRWLILK